MHYIQYYSPIISKITHNFNQNKEDSKELKQEGFIKLLQLKKICDEKKEDFFSDEWQKIIYTSVKNRMIDCIRSLKNRTAALELTEEMVSVDYNFNEYSIRESLKELSRILNFKEVVILKEILYPSDSLITYMQNKKMSLLKDHGKWQRVSKYLMHPDAHEFFNLSKPQFIKILIKIEEITKLKYNYV